VRGAAGGARAGVALPFFSFLFFFFCSPFFSPRAVNVNPADPSTGNFGICEGWRYFSLAAGFPLPAGYYLRAKATASLSLYSSSGLRFDFDFFFCLSVFLNFKSGFLESTPLRTVGST
jgi:hypothetical protein